MSFHEKINAGRTRHVTVFTTQPAPSLRLREQPPAGPELAFAPRRAHTFDLNSNLHCSIIGTCLTMAEVRHVLVKLDVAGARSATDHEVHAQGVLLAARNDAGGKLLNKALTVRATPLVVGLLRDPRTAADLARRLPLRDPNFGFKQEADDLLRRLPLPCHLHISC